MDTDYFDKLTEFVQNYELTPEDIKQSQLRWEAMEQQFEEEFRIKYSDPQGFLNRQYTI